MAVNFNASIREGNYSQCDCCGAITNVIVLEIPISKYFDGVNFETRHRSYWMCEECRKGLTRLLNRLEDKHDD